MKCAVVFLQFCHFASTISGTHTPWFYVLLALFLCQRSNGAIRTLRHQLIPDPAFPYVDCGSCDEINSLYQIQRAASYKLKLLHRAFATCRGTILEHKGHKAMANVPCAKHATKRFILILYDNQYGMPENGPLAGH